MTYYKYMLMFQIDVGSGYFAINIILLLESSLSFDIFPANIFTKKTHEKLAANPQESRVGHVANHVIFL